MHQFPDRLTEPLLAIRVDLLSLVEQGVEDVPFVVELRDGGPVVIS